MRRLAILSAMLFACIQFLNAQTPGKFEVSVGWGDQMAESLVWHQKPSPVGLLPESTTIDINENYKYTQHWFVEGRYNIKSWFSTGLMADFSGISWQNSKYNGTGKKIEVNSHENFKNICIMPSVRFTFLRKEYFQMYSGIACGIDINTGTEVDYLGNKTIAGAALYVNLLGMRGSYGRYSCGVDLGGLYSAKDMAQVFILGSRLISVSMGITL